MFRRAFLLLVLPVFLAACAGESYYSPDEVVDPVRYRHDGPKKLTLYTMVNNSTGSGAHTSLMINASERVIFDPAGTVNAKKFIPERNDVLFGISPGVEDFYTRAHARETFHVVIQEVEVSPAVAEAALKLALTNGAVPSAMCARSTSTLLSKVPGFQSVQPTWYPNELAEQFQKIPGVKRTVLREYDDGDKEKALEAWDPARFKAQTRKQAQN